MKLKKRYVLGLIVLVGIYLSGKMMRVPIETEAMQIEKHFGRGNSEFEKYKFEGNLVSKYNGLEFSIGEIMLVDRQLIVSMSFDYSDPKWAFSDKESLAPSSPTITIGDYVFAGQAGGYDIEKVKGEKKSNIILKTTLSSIDTDGDGIGDKDIEILDNISPNKEYDLKIEFNQLYSGNTGKWEFNTKIDASNIINSTKSYKVSKKINIDENEYKGELVIEEVRVSPVSVKVKYNYDLYDEISVEKRREPSIRIKDEYGNELESGPGEGGGLIKRRWNIVNEFLLTGKEKKLTVIPVSYVNDKQQTYSEGIIEIDLE